METPEKICKNCGHRRDAHFYDRGYGKGEEYNYGASGRGCYLKAKGGWGHNHKYCGCMNFE
jgi:hypothetical protein